MSEVEDRFSANARRVSQTSTLHASIFASEYGHIHCQHTQRDFQPQSSRERQLPTVSWLNPSNNKQSIRLNYGH